MLAFGRTLIYVVEIEIHCKDMWGRHCCLTSFFRLSIRALIAKKQADKVVR